MGQEEHFILGVIEHLGRVQSGPKPGVARLQSVQLGGKLFLARSCLGKVPGRAPFSQLSQQATACTIRMQIVGWKASNNTKSLA